MHISLTFLFTLSLSLLPTAEQLDCAYQEVKEVRSLGRGIGAWGDMVVVLNDGSKIEMRSLAG